MIGVNAPRNHSERSHLFQRIEAFNIASVNFDGRLEWCLYTDIDRIGSNSDTNNQNMKTFWDSNVRFDLVNKYQN